MGKFDKRLPKGAYYLPNGNYVVPGKPGKNGIRVSPVCRAEPDLKMLADAIIALAKELRDGASQESPLE